MKRTTHYAVSRDAITGAVTRTKVYAERDARGRFKNIYTYKKSHRADLRKKHTKSDR